MLTSRQAFSAFFNALTAAAIPDGNAYWEHMTVTYSENLPAVVQGLEFQGYNQVAGNNKVAFMQSPRQPNGPLIELILESVTPHVGWRIKTLEQLEALSEKMLENGFEPVGKSQNEDAATLVWHMWKHTTSEGYMQTLWRAKNLGE